MTMAGFGRLFLAIILTVFALFAQANSDVLFQAKEEALGKADMLFARGGGADTGGGDHIGGEPVSKAQVAELLKKVKFPAKYVIRRLELILTEFQGPQHLREANPFKVLATKLFAGPKSFEDALASAQFDPIPTGPCLDSLGRPFDASMLKSPVICFSLERLSEKLNSDSVETAILALLLHEVSHMLGATEDEAKFIQQSVKNTLVVRPFNSILTGYDSYTGLVDSKIETVRMILASLQEDQMLETCALVSSFLPSVHEVMQANMRGASNSDRTGITFSTTNEIIFINGILLKSLNSLGFCVSSFPIFKKIASIFGDRKEMDLQEFDAKIYDRAEDMNTYMPSPNWKIRKQSIGDTEAFKKEVQDILDTLILIRSRI